MSPTKSVTPGEAAAVLAQHPKSQCAAGGQSPDPGRPAGAFLAGSPLAFSRLATGGEWPSSD
jgi:hypothetical protein